MGDYFDYDDDDDDISRHNEILLRALFSASTLLIPQKPYSGVLELRLNELKMKLQTMAALLIQLKPLDKYINLYGNDEPLITKFNNMRRIYACIFNNKSLFRSLEHKIEKELLLWCKLDVFWAAGMIHRECPDLSGRWLRTQNSRSLLWRG